jgi:hypothetical protein
VAQLGCGVAQYRVRRGSVQGAAWLSEGGDVTEFRVRRDSVQGAAWLISASGVAQPGCGVNQYRVGRGSVEGCDVAQMRMRCGSVDRVGRGSVRVWSDSVQGAA